MFNIFEKFVTEVAFIGTFDCVELAVNSGQCNKNGIQIPRVFCTCIKNKYLYMLRQGSMLNI